MAQLGLAEVESLRLDLQLTAYYCLLTEVESHVNVATEQRAAEGCGVEELATLLDVVTLEHLS